MMPILRVWKLRQEWFPELSASASTRSSRYELHKKTRTDVLNFQVCSLRFLLIFIVLSAIVHNRWCSTNSSRFSMPRRCFLNYYRVLFDHFQPPTLLLGTNFLKWYIFPRSCSSEIRYSDIGPSNYCEFGKIAYLFFRKIISSCSLFFFFFFCSNIEDCYSVTVQNK